MAQRLILPGELGDVFTPAEALRFGISAGRLDRHPRVAAPFSGVRVRVDPPRQEESPWDAWKRTAVLHARAYARVMPVGAFVGGFTALAVLGLPTPRWHPDAMPDPRVVEISVFAPRRSVRATGVLPRQIRPALCHVVTRDGIPVASPASVWAMLADRLTTHQLVALGDAIIRIPRIPPQPIERAGPPKGTLAQLKAAVEAGPRAGVETLREAFGLVRQGSSSPGETEQRLVMLEAGLPEPVLDHDVYSARGVLLGCSEIAYPRLRTAIECEGDQHRTSRAQWDRDIDKYQAYAEAGWSVMRATDRLIHRRTDENVRRIRTLMVRAGWRPGDPVV